MKRTCHHLFLSHGMLTFIIDPRYDRVHWSYLYMVLQKFVFRDHILRAIMATLRPKCSWKAWSPNHSPVQMECVKAVHYPRLASGGTHLLQVRYLRPTDWQRFHKISLFADDVILILTNPTSSLAEVQSILNWLSKVSYYKVNTTKSFILDIKLDAKTKNLLQLQYFFTWADKDISYLGIQLPRCAHLKLIKHKSMGGMGSIDFEDYYLPTIFAQLPDWFQPLPKSLWSHIEKLSLIRPNLKSWLMSTPLGSFIPPSISPTMKASVHACKKMITLVDYTPSTTLYHIPLESLHYLTPLSQWTPKGIHSLQNLLQGKQLKSFSQLQEEYDLPFSEHFTFLRIHHCLGKIPLPLYNIHPKTWDYLMNPASKTKGITYFYNLRHKKYTFIKMSPHHLWESRTHLHWHTLAIRT